VVCLLIFIHFSCTSASRQADQKNKSDSLQSEQNDDSSRWKSKAKKMVEDQMVSRGIKDKKVLQALENTPRHLFVPKTLQDFAYADRPLPIGQGQTISQPYIVAIMTELLELKGDEKVLEIGTGSGYQAAILSQLVDTCDTIELISDLADQASALLKRQGYDNVVAKNGDGYKGWPEHAPFDCIIITAAPEEIPEKLVEQLKPGGRMVVLVGKLFQQLLLITKTEKGIKKKNIIPVRFVPMVKPKE
jgi:protein-L-isoaspartate(D-aspartate) O-methyltransferase